VNTQLVSEQVKCHVRDLNLQGLLMFLNQIFYSTSNALEFYFVVYFDKSDDRSYTAMSKLTNQIFRQGAGVVQWAS
jgi:hypothetical protein